MLQRGTMTRAERTVVGNGRLCEQDIALSWHTASDGVDGEAHVYALSTKHPSDVGDSVLSFCDCHTVADNKNDVLSISESFNGLVYRRLRYLTLNLVVRLHRRCYPTKEHVCD